MDGLPLRILRYLVAMGMHLAYILRFAFLWLSSTDSFLVPAHHNIVISTFKKSGLEREDVRVLG